MRAISLNCDAAGTSKSVTAAAEGTRQYQVRACSGAGCSGYSGTATTSIMLPPATTVAVRIGLARPEVATIYAKNF